MTKLLKSLLLIGSFLIVIGIIFSGGESTPKNEVVEDTPIESVEQVEKTKVEEKEVEKIEQVEKKKEVVEVEKIVEVEKTPIPTSSETFSQKNAVKMAKSYLDYSAFSYNGLITQLVYEEFTQTDAVYGADNSGADWNEQAVKMAKSYLDYSAFSYNGLITQLLYEKFTQAQAEYGADNSFIQE